MDGYLLLCSSSVIERNIRDELYGPPTYPFCDDVLHLNSIFDCNEVERIHWLIHGISHL